MEVCFQCKIYTKFFKVFLKDCKMYYNTLLHNKLPKMFSILKHER